MTVRILKYLGVFLLWNIAAGLALPFLPPPAGIVVVLALTALLLSRYLVRTGRAGAVRRWAVLRLRPLEGDTLRWTLAAVPTLIVISWALGEVYVGIVPVPAQYFDLFRLFGPLVESPLGRLSVVVFAVAIAPVVEEFFFRGLIQRPLERRRGAAWGIGFAAALFALVHFLPWVLPIHFFLGIAFGWVVYAARSIWAGVVLHAANNATAILGMGNAPAIDDGTAAPTIWDAGPSVAWWLALAALLLVTPIALRIARRLHEAGRRRRAGAASDLPGTVPAPRRRLSSGS